MSHVSFKLTNVFLKKMQVPEWGKQWYNGLRPENPGVLTLARPQWASHQKEKHGLRWSVLFMPLFLRMKSPLSKRNCHSQHSPSNIFMECDPQDPTRFWGEGTQGPHCLPRFMELLPQSITTTTVPWLFKELVRTTSMVAISGPWVVMLHFLCCSWWLKLKSCWATSSLLEFNDFTSHYFVVPT